MLCQECRRNEANIHIVKNINGKQSELNLCESCARKKDELDFSFEPQFSLHKLFTSMLNQGLYGKREEMLADDKSCPSCSLTFAQFGQVGRLGCSACVPAFEDKLKPLLKRIHGGSVHTGKVPEKARERVNILRELDQLKDDLQAKVQNEEFEQAAQIRDKIRVIEQNVNQKNADNEEADRNQEGEEH